MQIKVSASGEIEVNSKVVSSDELLEELEEQKPKERCPSQQPHLHRHQKHISSSSTLFLCLPNVQYFLGLKTKYRLSLASKPKVIRKGKSEKGVNSKCSGQRLKDRVQSKCQTSRSLYVSAQHRPSVPPLETEHDIEPSRREASEEIQGSWYSIQKRTGRTNLCEEFERIG